MYLVSTGKKTILSDFADLETKSIYDHANGETTDFQFFQGSQIFVELNKKSGLEVMRIKDKNDCRLELQRLRKLTIEKAFCIACCRQTPFEQIALGLSNGQIKIYNYKSSELLCKYNAEKVNSVVFLDYNASDEYVSSVYENGHINIFGTKTRAKIESINIDGNSTLARFHPTKRFHLATASYKGAVTIYDISAKRKLFNSTEAHGAPCRDLCMSVGAPDTLVSVGYDCVINIFDTRRKTQPMQLTHCHPLSTVSMTDSGTFFCVGNLKGELTTYDMRNLSQYICSKKLHDCAVNRVAFVSQMGKIVDNALGNSMQSNNLNITNSDGAAHQLDRLSSSDDLRKSVTTATALREHRDSFCDFLDFQANKGIEKMSKRFTIRRDSFDWEALMRKPSDTRMSLQQKASNLSGGIASIEGGSDSKNVVSLMDTVENLSNDLEQFADVKTPPQPNSIHGRTIAPLRERNRATISSINLNHIKEESNKINDASLNSDTETPQVQQKDNQVLCGPSNSTPNNNFNNLFSRGPAINQEIEKEISHRIEGLRLEINNKFSQLESEIKFINEETKWQLFTQAHNLWRKQNDVSEEIRDALGILLQTDPFVNEFLRLKQENENLKARLRETTEK